MFDIGSFITDNFESFFGNPSQAWDRFKNGRTNETNREIAEQNLEYQRERNAIEDKRYEEETAYNRQWAEEEREYNRALQQELFNREDTAMSRQASDLASIGINPLSVNMSGAGAGQAVSSATPSTASARGGQALNNNFQMQDQGVLQSLAPLASLANTINQVATGQGQRDLLQAQADKQYLDNYISAMRSGIWPRWNDKYNRYENNRTPSGGFFNSENLRNMDERNMFALDLSNKYKPDWARTMDYLVSDDFFNSAEKALTRGCQLFDKAFNMNLDKIDEKNPFKAFLNLFW